MRTHLIQGASPSMCWDYDHNIVPPLSASVAYRLDSVQRGAKGFLQFASELAEGREPIYIYDRLHEPTCGLLEENLAYAEGGQSAVCFATGMAAVSAAVGISLQAGEELVAHHTLYGCTYSLFTKWLPRFGITAKFADLRELDQLADCVSERTRVVYLETPVNPNLGLIDIAALRCIVDKINAARLPDRRVLIIVDNTFATPFCQRPLSLGADLVVHSLTKNIGGFGADMGGVVVGSQRFHEPLLLYRKDLGAVLSPRNAWSILVYGLPTLAARTVNQQKSALKVAQYLEKHEKVATVLYPGLESFPQRALAKRQMIASDGKFAPGIMLYFVLKGDTREAAEAAERLIDFIAHNAYSITLAVSLGQIRTLIEEPYSMTHSSLPEPVKLANGLVPGGVRLSLGLEDWHDIIKDLDAALAQI